MFFCILSLTSSLCSDKNYMIEATDSNYLQFFGKSKPLYIRYWKEGCIYTPASQAYWDEASKLLPNIQFVSAECTKKAIKFCQYVDKTEDIKYYPLWRIYHPNQTKSVTQFLDNSNIHSSSAYFTDTANRYAYYIPFDNPMIETLVPQSTNKFFKLYKYPIFLLYSSKCEKDIKFIDEFYVKLNNSEIIPGDYGFGKLDCSKYPDECNKWGGQFPSANVFSRAKGISLNINEIGNFSNQIQDAISQLDNNQLACPTPEPPISTPAPEQTPDYTGYTVIKNEALENRDVLDIQSKYFVATTKTYSGSCCTTKCGSELNNGNAATCTNYEIQPETIPDFLRQLNFYRELAGVPNNVTNDESLNYGCYLSAQYLSSKNKLSHYVNEKDRYKCNWNSYWQLLIDTLAQSNLAQNDNVLPPLDMLNGLMDDPGVNNEKEVGHRRWFLYPYLKTIGFGFYPLSKRPIGSSYAQTRETGVFRVSHNPSITTDYPGVPFIAWPAPGPFPVARVPESFSLTYSGFKSLTVNDINLTMTRDDGEALEYESIYLNIDSTIACLSSCLIWKLKFSSQTLCTSPHKVHVHVVIEKTKTIIDYTIEFFDNNVRDVSCFYDTDRSKCPSSLNDSAVFGKGQYHNYSPADGASSSIIQVVEDITLSSDLVFNFPSVNIQGSRIKGKIIISSSTKLDISDPSLTDIVIQCDPTSSLLIGSLSTTIQPKTLQISFTKLPKYSTKPSKSLVYRGSYVEFDYPKEVETIDFVYYFSIYYTGTEAYLLSVPIPSSRSLCYKSQFISQCSVFNDFSEIQNFVSQYKITKLYVNQPINLSTKGWNSNIFSNSKYIIYSNYIIQLEYAPSLNSRVREIYIEPMSLASSLRLSIVHSEYYPAPYLNQEISPNLYPLNNLFLTRYNANDKQYQIPNLIGDATAKNITSYAEQKVIYDSDFTNQGSYQYSDEYKYPLFVTNALYETYTFSSTNPEVNLRVQPSEQSKFNTVTLNFTSQFSSIFVQDYYYVTVIAPSNLLSKVRLVNVKQAKFIESSGNEVTGISTDVIGNESIVWSSANPVTFERLNFRTDTISKLNNCQCTNAYVYDSNPVIEDLKISNLQIIQSNPTLKNCQVTGSVIINLTNNYLSAIQLIGNNSVFNPTSIIVHVSSTVNDLSLFLVGFKTSQVSSLKSKITIENDPDSKYKVISSKDQKGLYIVNADFNEDEAPEVVEATNNFLINEYRKVSETFPLNPPPPGFNYTDSILYPLDKPSNSPAPPNYIPTETPTSTPVQTPVSKPVSSSQQPSQIPTQIVTPQPTLADITPLSMPEVSSTMAPSSVIENQGDDYIKINTQNIDHPNKSIQYNVEIDSSRSKVVVNNSINVNLQLIVKDNSNTIELSVENPENNLLIHGDNGANLKLNNSENVNISGSGSFVLNSAGDQELAINKFIPSKSATLSAEKDLTVKEMQIFGDVIVDGSNNEEVEAHYNVKNVKIEQGATLKSNNLKFESVEIGVGASVFYNRNGFTDAKLSIYYNRQTKQYPIEFNDLFDLSNPPVSIVILFKELGSTLSENKFVIAQKSFKQNAVSKSDVETILSKWTNNYVKNDLFNSIEYEINTDASGNVNIALFAVNKNDSTNQENGKKGLPTAAIIGIVAAVVAAVVVVIVVLVFIKRKRNYEQSTDDANLPNNNNNDDNKEVEAEEFNDKENI